MDIVLLLIIICYNDYVMLSIIDCTMLMLPRVLDLPELGDWVRAVLSHDQHRVNG